jgi:2-phosphoglycerate kinase
VIRGYLAQCELIEPVTRDLVDRISKEGADAVVEGVHIRPGALKGLGSGVIEIMVDPGEESHRAMFMTKHAAAKLKTVSGDRVLRQREFQATRLIQDYLTDQAGRAGVHVLKLSDYDDGERSICDLVVESVRRNLQTTTENK